MLIGRLSSHLRQLASSTAFPKTMVVDHHAPVQPVGKLVPTVPQIFNYAQKKVQRGNAAEYQKNSEKKEDRDQYSYLHLHVAQTMAEKLDDLDANGRQLPRVLELYSHADVLLRHLVPRLARLNTRSIVCAHSSAECLYRDADRDGSNGQAKYNYTPNIAIERVVLPDEEDLTIFPDNHFDMVISNLAFHWINNLPGMMDSVKRILKNDGLFLASMLGGDTLQELRSAFVIAEQEREGGIGPHVSPFMKFQDGARLLQSTHFALSTVDVDQIEVRYPDAFALMHDLRAMGESSAHIGARFPLPRDTMMAVAAVYQSMYSKKHESGGEGGDGVPATFQTIFLTGWKPDPSQQQPLERGSVKHGLSGSADEELRADVINLADFVKNPES